MKLKRTDPGTLLVVYMPNEKSYKHFQNSIRCRRDILKILKNEVQSWSQIS